MWFGRFLLWFFKPLAWLLFPFKTIGRENIPDTPGQPPLILCCNHISVIDPVFLEMCQKRHVYFMAKEEIFKNRLATWFFAKQLGAFPVKRGAGDTGALDTARRIVEEGKLLGIFPEGTRSKDGRLGRAKSGAALIAAQTGASVLPVAIATKNQKLRLFRPTRIVFGPPLSPEELHLDNPEHPDLRFASRLVMDRIGDMIAQNTR